MSDVKQTMLTLDGDDVAIVRTKEGDVWLQTAKRGDLELFSAPALAMAYIAIRLRDSDYFEKALQEAIAFFQTRPQTAVLN